MKFPIVTLNPSVRRGRPPRSDGGQAAFALRELGAGSGNDPGED